MKQGWCFARRSLVQGEPGCEGRGFFAVPAPPGRTLPAEQSGQHCPGIRIGWGQESTQSVRLQLTEPSAWRNE